MNTNRILQKSWFVASLLALIALGAVVFYYEIGHAQGDVSEQGLPARYIPAFDGAGIDTSALLGPHCKSAVATGGTLTIVCEDDDDPTNADAITAFNAGLDQAAVDGRIAAIAPDNSVTSATLSGTTAVFTKPDASTVDLDLSPLQTDGGLSQTAVDARIALGVANWAQTADASPIDADKLANAPDHSVTAASLSGTTATFNKADATNVHLDLSGLRNPHAFVGVAYDQSENQLTLTTAGGRTIDVDLDSDYPPPTPVVPPPPSTDAALASLTLGGVAPNSWQPRFTAGTHSYNVRVGHAIFRTFVEPHTNDAAATFAVSDNRTGDDHDPTATGRLVELPTGETVITVRVTAEDGTTTQDYTVTVHRASS